MKISRFFASTVTAILLAPMALSALQAVQDWKSILHTSLPTSIKLSEIPADFTAVELTTTGSTGGFDLMGGGYSSLMMISMAFSQGSAADRNAIKPLAAFAMSQVSWTAGEEVKIHDKAYLVTYKIAIDMSSLAGSMPKFPDSMSLNLLAVDSISTIKPRPDVTVKSFSAAFDGLLDGASDAVVSSQTYDSANAAAHRTAHLSNVKQIALGMIMYVNDYDDVLPYAQDSKSAYYVTYPYVKNLNLFSADNPNGGIVRFNIDIAGVNETTIPAPAETPLYYDSEEWPDGNRCVAFCDGHAKYISRGEWQAMQRFMHLKLKRTTKPLPANYGLQWDKLIQKLPPHG